MDAEEKHGIERENVENATDPSVELLFADYVDRINAGEKIDAQEVVAEHPDHAFTRISQITPDVIVSFP